MSSQRPSVVVHVTGFSKFFVVLDNPTEKIVTNLKRFMEKRGLPEGLVLGSCNVLETAGEGAVHVLDEFFQNAVAVENSSDRDKIILLHLGVDIGAAKFAIEHQAFNEATFFCEDAKGWKPEVSIENQFVPSDGSISRVRQTSLPVNEIVNALSKMGYAVSPSDDAGRYVCNYVYYHSLRFAEQNRIQSLFVHVPSFKTIGEEAQMEFVASLLHVLASLN